MSKMWFERRRESERISGRICCMNLNMGKSPFRGLHRLAPQAKCGDYSQLSEEVGDVVC